MEGIEREEKRKNGGTKVWALKEKKKKYERDNTPNSEEECDDRKWTRSKIINEKKKRRQRTKTMERKNTRKKQKKTKEVRNKGKERTSEWTKT